MVCEGMYRFIMSSGKFCIMWLLCFIGEIITCEGCVKSACVGRYVG